MNNDIIASASLLANDKHFRTHAEWVRNFSAELHKKGSLEKPWNGSVKGRPVPACIDSSRWIAYCPYCGKPEAVDIDEKFFFCFTCNMVENDYEAVPVQFPDAKTISEIVAVLMERPVKVTGGPTKYERIVRMRPVIGIERDEKRYGLGRDWHFSQTVDDLHREQDDLIRLWKERQHGI